LRKISVFHIAVKAAVRERSASVTVKKNVPPARKTRR